ncbi:hypothetical protein [Paenibacillus thalictri]|uniref:Uncharacterized protein n=1 Tax=Paenibacillus thalictri TaxID=2527873 RepID=A0A4Q9DWZ0_9BACL|nr:hypothetical protein [Paenibacillus thalictri]TBL80540.1 hypothetical protein EYB31_04750 [Paenibacillus thalictri]
MTTFEQRRAEILRSAALTAAGLPLKDSGLWFHADLRDNYYFAIHLYAFITHTPEETRTEQQKHDLKLAVRIISKVLSLQDQNPESPMYGHWPLNLGENPDTAKPHVLPVELMGCLIAFFYDKYAADMDVSLKSELSLALTHIYQSGVYRNPLEQIHHHEAKHTSLKLLLGHLFGDNELLAEGIECARRQLAHVQTFGFKEYGALPWFWHWVQAFTCVWEVVDDPRAKAVSEQLLGYLWELRAEYYLKGTWIGPKSREWPHDAPRDRNTPHDYIQFGDFPAPLDFPRVEGAALYSYQIPAAVREKGTTRAASGSEELKKRIRITNADAALVEDVHSYTYVTPEYAVGGLWERRLEFDNEQHRWNVTLPLTNVANGVNQAYFFHPGEKYKPGDDRHASPYGEVLLHRNSACALYILPQNAGETLIGCLPRGQWIFNEHTGAGKIGDVYIAFAVMQPYTTEEKPERISVSSSGRINGVMMEAISEYEARSIGIESLEQLQDRWGQLAHRQVFRQIEAAEDNEAGDTVVFSYESLLGTKLEMSLTAAHDEKDCRLLKLERSVNGSPVDFTQYKAAALVELSVMSARQKT